MAAFSSYFGLSCFRDEVPPRKEMGKNWRNDIRLPCTAESCANLTRSAQSLPKRETLKSSKLLEAVQIVKIEHG
jgi:hypothetical protein